MRSSGVYSRAVDKRENQPYDIISNAPCSTDFSTSRFLTPVLCQSRWALFVDCDVVFLRDVHEILEDVEADPGRAVYVVQHPEHSHRQAEKMGGLVQTQYSRKNWSSVMLFDCDHPANRRLAVGDVNMRPGRDLHRFYWLHDEEIGSLYHGWNWLVGVRPKPANLGIAHFTLGGPWIPGWPGKTHDDIWTKVYEDLKDGPSN